MGRPYGFVPRDAVEEAAWPALKGQIFLEATDVFLRLLRGEVLSSNDTYETVLTRKNFRSDGDWERFNKLHMTLWFPLDTLEVPIANAMCLRNQDHSAGLGSFIAFTNRWFS